MGGLRVLVAVDKRFPRLDTRRKLHLGIVHAHRPPEILTVLLGGETMHHLEVCVFHSILAQLGGNLLSNDNTLSVLPVLSECVGEGFRGLLLGLCLVSGA